MCVYVAVGGFQNSTARGTGIGKTLIWATGIVNLPWFLIRMAPLLGVGIEVRTGTAARAQARIFLLIRSRIAVEPAYSDPSRAGPTMK